MVGKFRDFSTCTNNVTFVTWYKWNMTIANFLSAYIFLSELFLPEIFGLSSLNTNILVRYFIGPTNFEAFPPCPSLAWYSCNCRPWPWSIVYPTYYMSQILMRQYWLYHITPDNSQVFEKWKRINLSYWVSIGCRALQLSKP